MNPLTYIQSTAARLLVGLLIVIAIAGYSFHAGVKTESEHRDALDHQAQIQVDASFNRMLDRGRESARAALAKNRTITVMAVDLKRRADNATERDLATTNKSCGPSNANEGAVPGIPACFVTRYFVGLWNDARRLGSETAKPLSGDTGGASAAEREATTVGPRQLLANEQANAASCARDRVRLDELNRLLYKLDAEWAKSHP